MKTHYVVGDKLIVSDIHPVKNRGSIGDVHAITSVTQHSDGLSMTIYTIDDWGCALLLEICLYFVPYESLTRKEHFALIMTGNAHD